MRSLTRLLFLFHCRSATARFYRPDPSSRDAFVDDIYNPLPPEFFEDAKDTTRVQQLKRPGVLVR